MSKKLDSNNRAKMWQWVIKTSSENGHLYFPLHLFRVYRSRYKQAGVFIGLPVYRSMVLLRILMLINNIGPLKKASKYAVEISKPICLPRELLKCWCNSFPGFCCSVQNKHQMLIFYNLFHRRLGILNPG